MTTIETNELKRLRKDARFAELLRDLNDRGALIHMTRPPGSVIITIDELTPEERKKVQSVYNAIFSNR